MLTEGLTTALGHLPEGFVYWYQWTMLALFLVLQVFLCRRVVAENAFVRIAREESLRIRTEFLQVGDRVYEFDRWIQSLHDEKRSGFWKNKRVPSEKIIAWNRFKASYEEHSRSGSETIPDVYDFFTEELFLPKNGLREIIPGLFLSFGILGTFIGVSAGLSNIHLGENIDAKELERNIGDLVSGMKIKFGASGVGIILSILWQVFDKWCYRKKFLAAFVDLRFELDKTFPLPQESEILERMADSQQQQMKDFQDFFSDVVIEKMVRGVGEAVSTAIAPHLEQSNQMMEQFMNLSGDKQVEGMRQMAEQFLESLQSTSGEQMKHLGVLLERMIDWQEKTHQETSELITELQTTARGQSEMLKHTTELTTVIGSYIHNIDQATAHMAESAESSSLLQERLAETLKNMTMEREVFHDHFQTHMKSLEANLSVVVASTEKQSTIQERQVQVFERFENNLAVLSNASQGIGEVAATFSAQIEATGEFWERFENIMETVNTQAHQYSEVVTQVNEVLNYVHEHRLALDERSQEVQVLLVSQMEEIDRRTEQMREILDQANGSLSETNQQLSHSMTQFSHDLNTGLTRAFNIVDEHLSQCVDHLGKVVVQISEQTSELPEQIEKFRDSVRELNKIAVAARDSK